MFEKFSEYSKQYQYRLRIILTFTLLSAGLVIIMSRVSYYFVSELYHEQLSDQVIQITEILSRDIEAEYISLLTLGNPTSTIKKVLKSKKLNQIDYKKNRAILFDRNFNILISSEKHDNESIGQSHLELYKSDLYAAASGKSFSTLPFKGNDGEWYMWGFHNFNDKIYLGYRESADNLKKVEDFSNLFWAIGGGGVLLTILIGWVTANSISKPIDLLIRYSNKIAEGNFDASKPGNMKGELKKLADAMQSMNFSLAENQKEREKILAQIAHEIRNPLGGIELLANLTREDLEKKGFSTEYADKILYEVAGLNRLITSYLNYSKPSKPEMTLLNVKPLFDDIEAVLNNELGEKKIRFNAKCKEDDELFFDQNHLRQILINLVKNSIEMISEGEEISMEFRRMNNKFEIIISDNGPGISDHNVENIFNPFFTTKPNGTGLGLAISRKLCTENKSQLHFVESSIGAVFKIIGNVR